jgi:extradiol dioxygenase family protein
VDFDFFGHQLVIHQAEKLVQNVHNPVDGKSVPVPHYGVILEWGDFDELVARLRYHNINMIIEPYMRFEGKPGEQKTMFFYDPSGNALEFKSFRNDSEIFNT